MNTTDDTSAADRGSALSDGLGAAADARCCWHCDDGDGNCVFPYYGTAPHTHDLSAGWIGSTRMIPREQWEPNFREDPESPGAGVYMRCPHCNRGEPEAPNSPLADWWSNERT